MKWLFLITLLIFLKLAAAQQKNNTNCKTLDCRDDEFWYLDDKWIQDVLANSSSDLVARWKEIDPSGVIKPERAAAIIAYNNGRKDRNLEEATETVIYMHLHGQLRDRWQKRRAILDRQNLTTDQDCLWYARTQAHNRWNQTQVDLLIKKLIAERSPQKPLAKKPTISQIQMDDWRKAAEQKIKDALIKDPRTKVVEAKVEVDPRNMLKIDAVVQESKEKRRKTTMNKKLSEEEVKVVAKDDPNREDPLDIVEQAWRFIKSPHQGTKSYMTDDLLYEYRTPVYVQAGEANSYVDIDVSDNFKMIGKLREYKQQVAAICGLWEVMSSEKLHERINTYEVLDPSPEYDAETSARFCTRLGMQPVTLLMTRKRKLFLAWPRDNELTERGRMYINEAPMACHIWDLDQICSLPRRWRL